MKWDPARQSCHCYKTAWFEAFLQLLDNLYVDERRRIWIAFLRHTSMLCVIEEDMGQERMEVEIDFQVSHVMLERRQGVHRMKGMHNKSEIVQLELSDLNQKSSI